MHAKRNGYSFSYREVNFFRSSMDLCIQEIQKAVKAEKTIVIIAGDKNNQSKLREILEDMLKDNIRSLIINFL